MAEKDASARLRRAVKDNNLFLVKRLVQRTDIRNPDPTTRRYTSLAWAAVLGHGETFEFLLNAGHDDLEVSRDSEENGIIALLADSKFQQAGARSAGEDSAGILRMAQKYTERYVDILPELVDLTNTDGKSALHIAALKGNEELVRMLCDWGADVDLPDGEGNTPLHYASAWGHIPVVQLLIERGCQYTARNNENYTASDYAYTYGTRETLQDAARMQYELNKKFRRVARPTGPNDADTGLVTPKIPSPLLSKPRDIRQVHPRVRSGSGTSRSTATSDSGDADGSFLSQRAQQSISTASSSPSLPSNLHTQFSSTYSSLGNYSSSTLGTQATNIVTRMRERDADAIEKYMKRNRSGSASTDTKSQNDSFYFTSAGPSANGDDITSLNHIPKSGMGTQRRLRPSMSASQLRTTPEETFGVAHPPAETRNRAGTSPTAPRPPVKQFPPFNRSSSSSNSHDHNGVSKHVYEEPDSYDNYTGPPSQYATFPNPPEPLEADNSTPTISSRRLGFRLLSKSSFDSSSSQEPSKHRRGSSSTSIR